MAKRVEQRILGIDVAKDWLDIADGDGTETQRIDNQADAIRTWVQRLDGPVCVAVESANCFHERVMELLYEAGHSLYLIDPLRLSRYRDAVGHRAKTDLADATLLARYLCQGPVASLVAFDTRGQTVLSPVEAPGDPGPGDCPSATESDRPRPDR